MEKWTLSIVSDKCVTGFSHEIGLRSKEDFKVQTHDRKYSFRPTLWDSRFQHDATVGLHSSPLTVQSSAASDCSCRH